MDEKEIERIIKGIYEGHAMWSKYPDGTFREDWEEMAAHAIHKRLQEGVVWEGEGQIVHPRVSGGSAVSVPGIGRLLIDDRPSESRIGPHGQRVQVTVRRMP